MRSSPLTCALLLACAGSSAPPGQPTPSSGQQARHATAVSLVRQYVGMRHGLTKERVALVVCAQAAEYFPNSSLEALVAESPALIASVERVAECRSAAPTPQDSAAPQRLLIVSIGPDPADASVGLLRANSILPGGVGVTEIVRFSLPSWRAWSLEFAGFKQHQPPPPEFQGVPRVSPPIGNNATERAAVVADASCGDPESRLGSSLLAYLRAMLTRPRFHYLAPKFGLNVADSASIRMITDPAECDRAAHAFIRERNATLPKLVYVAAIGHARWVEDPETKAGEYIAGVVFTATYDSVLALPGR